MGQFPDLTVIVIKDLVLNVVLLHVCNDQLVIDDCWSNSLLLDLLLGLEVILDALLHGLPIGHHYS